MYWFIFHAETNHTQQIVTVKKKLLKKNGLIPAMVQIAIV